MNKTSIYQNNEYHAVQNLCVGGLWETMNLIGVALVGAIIIEQ